MASFLTIIDSANWSYKSEDAPPKAEMHGDGLVCYVSLLKCVYTRKLISHFMGLNDNPMLTHHWIIAVLVIVYFTNVLFMFPFHSIKTHYHLKNQNKVRGQSDGYKFSIL
jgi:hypothetical protein